ncbi:hypothetical protein RV18_GL000693 [Enterococcus termitis]|nr:hypothetical protein RV18_GL000693 [Enterococcus termitis]
MFAKLIVSSMNSDFDNTVHPAFVETIKQMSVLDAKIVKSFRNVGTHTAGNIIQVMNAAGEYIPKGAYFTLLEDFYIFPDPEHTLNALSQATSNLIRLGIISIDPKQNMDCQDIFLKDSRVSDFMNKCSFSNTTNKIRTSRLDVTPFGSAFKGCVI